MKIKNHGVWHTYAPSNPKGPPGALFTHRDSDATDWYDYLRSGENFDEDSVKLTVVRGVVGAATTDPTRLWPGDGGTVLEIIDPPLGDPQKLFGEKVWNETKQTFDDRPPLPKPHDDLLERIEALEARMEGPACTTQ